MNLGIRKVLGGIISNNFGIQFTQVRYRYYAERIAKGPIIKKFGYEEKIFREGILPRLKDQPLKIKVPKRDLYETEYKPANAWTVEKATAGQNDYIDILGGGKIKPSQVLYHVPSWLRGKKGNEMQLLILKSKVFNNTTYKHENPSAWYNIHRRIRYLYKYLNRKTKTGLSKD